MGVKEIYWASIANEMGAMSEVRIEAESIQSAVEKLIDAYGDVVCNEFGVVGTYKKLSEIALDATVPTTPAFTLATPEGGTTIVATLTAPLTGATFYLLGSGAATGDPLLKDVVKYLQTDFPVTIAELTPETEYKVIVIAVNSAGISTVTTVNATTAAGS